MAKVFVVLVFIVLSVFGLDYIEFDRDFSVYPTERGTYILAFTESEYLDYEEFYTSLSLIELDDGGDTLQTGEHVFDNRLIRGVLQDGDGGFLVVTNRKEIYGIDDEFEFEYIDTLEIDSLDMDESFYFEIIDGQLCYLNGYSATNEFVKHEYSLTGEFIDSNTFPPGHRRYNFMDTRRAKYHDMLFQSCLLGDAVWQTGYYQIRLITDENEVYDSVTVNDSCLYSWPGHTETIDSGFAVIYCPNEDSVEGIHSLCVLAKYSSDLEFEWEQRYDLSEGSEIYNIAQLSDGHIFLLERNIGYYSDTLYIWKLDQHGELLDRRLFLTGDDQVFGNLKVTPTDQLIITGIIHSDHFIASINPDDLTCEGIKTEHLPLPTTLSITAQPNPFNSTVEISVTVPDGTDNITVTIYDITGKMIKELTGSEGNTFFWNGKDQSGEECPTGAYLYKVTHGDEAITDRILFVK